MLGAHGLTEQLPHPRLSRARIDKPSARQRGFWGVRCRPRLTGITPVGRARFDCVITISVPTHVLVSSSPTVLMAVL
jgi:hypothetical protein